MSGAIATAYVQLVPKFDGLQSSISKQLGGVDTKGPGMKLGRLFTRNVDKGMGGLKGAMTSRFNAATVGLGMVAANVVGKAFSAIGNSMDAAIRRVDTINNFPRIMEGMGIGAEASAASIKKLSNGIDGLPTALDDAVSGVSRFTAKNSDIDRSTDYFLAVNNAIAAGGQSMATQSTALEQLSQSYSKGKMDMMEWRSLQQAMPAQLNQIAKAMGVTTDQLGEGLRNGEISMDSFMDKIVELNKEGVDGFDSFEKQARKATGGIGTALTNVQNRVNKAVAGIIDAIGQENISNAINEFSSQFGKIGSIIGGTDSEGNVVGFVAGLKRGLESAFDGWEPQLNIDWDAAFSGATQAAEQFGEFISGPLATLIQSVDEGMAQLGDAWQTAMDRLNLPEIDWESLSLGISGLIEQLSGLTFDTLTNALTTIADVGGSIASVVAPAIEAMGPGLEKIGKAVSEFVSPIADFMSGNGPAFEGMMWRIKEHVYDMEGPLSDLADDFNRLAEKLEPIGGPMGEAAAEVLGNLFSAIVGLGAPAVVILDNIVKSIEFLLDLFPNLGKSGQMEADALMREWGLVPGTFDTVMGAAEQTKTSIEKIPSSKTTTIKVDDQASSVLSGVLSTLGSIASTWVARVSTVTNGAGGTFAEGGLLSTRIERIPRHADGGMAGIASAPTLTNVGWVGEAGAEAIIPLTNRRYVRPFAQAVAAEMGGASTRSSYVNVYLQYDASADANDVATDIARALNRKLAMEA